MVASPGLDILLVPESRLTSLAEDEIDDKWPLAGNLVVEG